MQKVKVFLLMSLLLSFTSPSALAVRKQFYAGLGIGLESQRYNVKIDDQQAGNRHDVDASRLSPLISVFGGARTRFQNKFMAGLELGASFFPSEVKKDINNSSVDYALKNRFMAVEAAALLGYLYKKIDTMLYLKLGIEYRNIRLEVNSTGSNSKIDQNKSAFGALAALGLEFPIKNNFYIGAEGKFRLYQSLKYKSEDGTSTLNARVKPCFEGFNLRLVYLKGKR